MTDMFKKEDIAYAAGLLDGEGSVGASASPRCRKNYRVCVSIGMCDRQGLDFISSKFGGRVTKLKSQTKSGKAIYQWALHCRKAADFLELTLPFLRVKASKARDAIALARMMRGRREAKTIPVTNTEIIQRGEIADRLRAANYSSNGRLPNAIA